MTVKELLKTVKELLKYVVCNVEVWNPIDGKKIWNFDRRCIEKVDPEWFFE